MKCAVVVILALLLSWPAISHAQYNDTGGQADQDQYQDVEDGQLLKVASYLLTPFGMALEWGVMRPLHYLATQTSAAPWLSGDTGDDFFGENHNADMVPPGTFGYRIDPTNDLQLSRNKASLSQVSGNRASVPVPRAESSLPSAQNIPPSPPVMQSSQPALH
jgi:hypothetical protein